MTTGICIIWPVHVKVKVRFLRILIALETETRDILQHYEIMYFDLVKKKCPR